MKENSHCFRELDIRQVLADQDYFAISPRAHRHIKSNIDLFNSHFCDDEYYVPVKKRSICFDEDIKKESKIKIESQLGASRQKKGMMKKKENKLQTLNTKGQQNLTREEAKTQMKIKIKPNLIIETQNQANVYKPMTIRPITLNEKYNQQSLISNNKESGQIKNKQVELVLIDKKYFIRSKTSLVQVNEANMKTIYDQFVKKQLYIPFYYYRRCQEWKNSDQTLKFDQEYEPHQLFKSSITHYVTYLHSIFPSQLSIILNSISQRKNLKINTSKSAIINLQFIHGALDSLKSYIYTSKIESLRKVLLAKWRTLKSARIQANRWNICDLMHDLKAQEAQIWRRIGDIEILICFQETEKHCLKKMEESSNKKVKQYWSHYRNIIIRQLEKQLEAIGKIKI